MPGNLNHADGAHHHDEEKGNRSLESLSKEGRYEENGHHQEECPGYNHDVSAVLLRDPWPYLLELLVRQAILKAMLEIIREHHRLPPPHAFWRAAHLLIPCNLTYSLIVVRPRTGGTTVIYLHNATGHQSPSQSPPLFAFWPRTCNGPLGRQASSGHRRPSRPLCRWTPCSRWSSRHP